MAGFTLEYQNKMAVQQFANAMYDLQVGSDTMDQVLSDIDLLGSTDAAFNSYYDFTYGQATDAEVAATMVANFGIDAAEAADAEAYIAGVLGAADPGAKGAAANDIIETFASLTDDAVFGPAATAWNAEVSTAMDYDGAADLTAGEVVAPETHFMLSSASDYIDGSAVADTFDAPLVQDGGVTNSLSSADHLDGGAGDDLLNAVIVPEFFGSTGDYQVDVQPAISGIETIQLQSQDTRAYDSYDEFDDNLAGANGNLDTGFFNVNAVFDAKDVTGVDSIGSYFSDGDLVIENLTTLTDEGGLRNTSDLTITMNHTDNFDHDEDASDLTVLFDEDYLLSGQQTTASAVAYYLLDEESSDYDTQPLLNIERDGVKFILDGVEYTVGMSFEDSQAADDWATFTADLQASLAALQDPTNPDYNEELVGLSFVHDTDNTYFPNEATFNDAGVQVPIDPIVLIDSLGRDIDGSGFTSPEEATGNFDIFGTWDNDPSDTLDLPISINVELDKVGRDGDGGNLIIGGKDQNYAGDHGYDVDQRDGISQFDIAVLGDAARPSNLGQILSTNDTLDTVNISSPDTTLDSFASLTVRGSDSFDDPSAPFGGTLSTLNANAFLGDLYIGQEGHANNITTFTATGGGDVSLWADNGPGTNTVTTGSGDDYLNIDDAGVLSVNSGGGDDYLDIYVGGVLDNDIAAGSGNDVIYMSGEDNAADIDAGSGNDFVDGGEVAVTVTDGLGNDVVYVQNNGTQAVQTIATSTEDGSADTLGSINPAAHDPLDAQLMFGRTVQVTVAAPNAAATAADSFVEGFESLVVNVDTDTYISTLAEFNQAIVDAINDDAVLGNLATASASTGDVVVSWDVDGVVSTIGSVEVEVGGVWADLTSSEQAGMLAEFKAAYPDSTITAGELEAAYDGITDDYTASTANTSGVAEGDTTANTVIMSGGNDFIALSSDATDTVVFESGVNFGSDALVNLDVNTAGDILDFTDYLDDMFDPSATVDIISATRIDTTLGDGTAVINNQVAVTTFSALDAATATALNFDTMTNAQVLATLNEAGGYAVGAADADLIGTTQSFIFMVENDANLGEYKVYEGAASDVAGTDEFDAVNLIGTIDTGSTEAFNVADLA